MRARSTATCRSSQSAPPCGVRCTSGWLGAGHRSACLVRRPPFARSSRINRSCTTRKAASSREVIPRRAESAIRHPHPRPLPEGEGVFCAGEYNFRMARQPGPPRRWLSGFGNLEWRTDERAYASLLDALTRDRLEVEAVEREMQATGRRSLAEGQQDQQRAERAELAQGPPALGEFSAAVGDLRRGRGGR